MSAIIERYATSSTVSTFKKSALPKRAKVSLRENSVPFPARLYSFTLAVLVIAHTKKRYRLQRHKTAPTDV